MHSKFLCNFKIHNLLEVYWLYKAHEWYYNTMIVWPYNNNKQTNKWTKIKKKHKLNQLKTCVLSFIFDYLWSKFLLFETMKQTTVGQWQEAPKSIQQNYNHCLSTSTKIIINQNVNVFFFSSGWISTTSSMYVIVNQSINHVDWVESWQHAKHRLSIDEVCSFECWLCGGYFFVIASTTMWLGWVWCICIFAQENFENNIETLLLLMK